jgi:nucleoid-associated protein YgaU
MNKKIFIIFSAIVLLGLFFIGRAPVKATENTDKNTEAYWSFDEPASSSEKIIDHSGSGNTGTNYIAKVVGGVSGQAFYFNGYNNYIKVPNSPSLNFGTGDLTVSAWIKTTASTVGWDEARDEILAKGDPFISGYSLSLLHNRPAAHWGGTGRTGFVEKNKSLNDGQWHNIVAVRDNGQVKIYADGQLKLEYPCAEDLDVRTDLFIGRHGTKLLTYFEGKIDEVKILNYALLDKEILSVYNEVLSKYDSAAEEKIDQANGFDAKKEFDSSAAKNVIEYTVEAGDTLESITTKLCGSTRFLETIFSLEDFQKENGQLVLNVGDKLKLSKDLCDPNNSYNQNYSDSSQAENSNIETHVVLAGETLWGIAEKKCGRGYLWKKIFKPESFSTKENGNILIKEGEEIPADYSACQDYSAEGESLPADAELENENIKSHLVLAGETLWGIAAKECGQGSLWNRMFKPEEFSIKSNGNILIKEGEKIKADYSACKK